MLSEQGISLGQLCVKVEICATFIWMAGGKEEISVLCTNTILVLEKLQEV